MARRKRRTGGRGGIPAATDSPQQVSILPKAASEALPKSEFDVSEVAPAGDAAACGCDEDKHERSLHVDEFSILDKGGVDEMCKFYDQCYHDYSVLEAEIIKKGDEMCEERRIAMITQLSELGKKLLDPLLKKINELRGIWFVESRIPMIMSEVKENLLNLLEKIHELREMLMEKLLQRQRQQLLLLKMTVEAKGKKCEQVERVEADDVKNEEGSLDKMSDVKEETQAEEGGKECWRCISSPVKTLLCVGCRKARYCDKQCQEEDWDNHWEYCDAKNNKRAFKEFRFMSTKLFA